jgi:hypothetical protein
MMLHNIHINTELHKKVTMEQQEWPEGRMADPREKHKGSTSLLQTPRNSPHPNPSKRNGVKYFEEKRGHVRINVTMKRVLITVAAVERKKCFQYCKCVSVTLVIQHTNRMRCIMSSVASMALPCIFSTSQATRFLG